MEEDIVYLEEVIDLAKTPNVHLVIKEKEIEAIENLIKGYRELEEENARLGMLNLVQEDMIKELENNSIPKSKIKEKIEELEKGKDETYTRFLASDRKEDRLSTKGKMLEGGIQALQELMEDK